MATIKDLLALDFSKSEADNISALKTAIDKIIEDYNHEEDKEFFEKEAAKNIDALYSMVEEYAPEAIPKADKEKSEASGKEKAVKASPGSSDGLRKLVDKVIRELDEIRDDHPGSDLEDILENTMYGLQNALESEDENLPKGIKKAVEPYLSWEKTIEHNQLIRLGSVDLSVKEGREQVAKIIAGLLAKIGKKKPKPNKQLPKNGNSKKSKAKPELTKALIREVIDELTDLGIDLKGESEIVIASARMDLEEALDSNGDELENLVKEAIQNFRDWLDEIREDPKATSAIALVNKLIVALGEKTIPEVVPSKREKSKQFMEKLEGIEGDIEACRAVIREHNRKKREAEGPKPKKTRYTQLREKLLAVISIIPDKLKDDQEVQQKTEGILLHTHRELVRAWGMSKVKAKAGANAIKEKFDALEEKTAKEERKTILARWKKDLPDVDKLVPKISKDKQTLKEAAIEVINHLKQAIAYFEDDPAKAAKYLKAHFEQEQLEKHLPKYVKEALKL
ncbi:hypothetical protein LVD17_00215 [Fulvivirga ulvae]|uniref:hypothetical protein n=1 Tax=Fulvivirga ulvae TaxID=2904245 RepID=UPI001F3837A1|nr:hypothetical protein [Fulvivirga ulvae]UII32260.1 hypothetical protein LVD17_00215 [Fulvivirga ulvae]